MVSRPVRVVVVCLLVVCPVFVFCVSLSGSVCLWLCVLCHILCRGFILCAQVANRCIASKLTCYHFILTYTCILAEGGVISG